MNSGQANVTSPPRPISRGAARAWRRLLGRAAVVLLGLVVLLALAVGVGYWNVNVRQSSGAEFARRLGRAVERGRAWLEANVDKGPMQYHNPVVHFLFQDMHRLHDTPAFARRVQDFLARPASPESWKRLVDPRQPFYAPDMNAALPGLPLDYRWLAYALKPGEVALAQSDRQGLFDPERYDGLVLAHQLFALCHLRRRHDDPRASAELVAAVSRRLARSHSLDVILHKLHAERPGFLIMAGHAELVRRAWLDRILDNQLPDGGWNDRLYALGLPTPIRDHGVSDEHSTVVALWTLYQVQYACPEQFGLPRQD